MKDETFNFHAHLIGNRYYFRSWQNICIGKNVLLKLTPLNFSSSFKRGVPFIKIYYLKLTGNLVV